MSKIKYVEELIGEVVKDYEARRERRRPYELAWRLNLNFLVGNQYSYITPRGDIETSEKQYFWQSREVFNHIAPIVESRLSKLQRVRPTVTVRPYTDNTDDILAAQRSETVLGATFERINFPRLISEATVWSEVCGTSFYKIQWDTGLGNGLPDNPEIKEGDLSLEVVPPFEIYPDSNECAELNDCASIIHAKTLSLAHIKNLYNIDLDAQEIYTSNPYNISTGSNAEPSAVVIERYEAPTRDLPEGRLVIVAGNKLLYVGKLPYTCGENGTRTFPFVKQISTRKPGSFWGSSVIERLIPIQRSFNAVKNRKFEYLNRLVFGVLAVEEGSVNKDELQDDGLYPGKMLVYRQGSTPPAFLKEENLPSAFNEEEEKLKKEFVTVSNNPDIMSSGESAVRLASGTALNLIIEQDNDKLTTIADNIRCAIKEAAKQLLRVFKQYADFPRAVRRTETKELLSLSGNDITSFDVVFSTENEQNLSIAAQRSAVLELYSSGLLFDENGKLPRETRNKILSLMGYDTLI